MFRKPNRLGTMDRLFRLSVTRSFRSRRTAPANASTSEPGSSSTPNGTKPTVGEFLAWAAVTFFVIAVVRRGWISDDAFITVRAVDHLVEGRGLVYNADERVLGFTNPLWALLLAIPYALIRDPYWTPMLASIAVSAFVAYQVAFRSSSDCRVGALVVLALSFSRSFVDFSTSGLENPLSHLLLVLFYLEYFRGGRGAVGRLSLYAALLLVNRFDLAWLVLPPLWVAFRQRLSRDEIRSAVLGWTPAVTWFAFALVYYGFPLPNTAYAKLNADIPKREMIRQGLSYLADALVNDTQTIVLILAAALVLMAMRKSDARNGAVFVALALAIGYVVLIGGDFMSGRFLTPILAVAAVVLANRGGQWLSAEERLRGAALSVVGVILCLAFSPLRDDPLREKREFPVTRIVNERGWFQEHLLLHLNVRPVQWKSYGLYAEGVAAKGQNRRVVLYNNVGMFAWGAGPDIHVVDDMALTDPLLARIPFAYREDWRTGHLPRPIPEGYLDSLESGRNVIRDPCIAQYFDQLNRIVRGPLFTAERWTSILELNLPGALTVHACPDRIPAATPQAAPETPVPSEPTKAGTPNPAVP